MVGDLQWQMAVLAFAIAVTALLVMKGNIAGFVAFPGGVGNIICFSLGGLLENEACFMKVKYLDVFIVN